MKQQQCKRQLTRKAGHIYFNAIIFDATKSDNLFMINLRSLSPC